MFQGRVYTYKRDENGREQSFTKHFDDANEFNSFVNGNQFQELSSPGGLLGSYLEDMFSSKMIGDSPHNHRLPEGVDLSKYEKESQKIDMDEQEKKNKRESLEQAQKDLEEYRKKFDENNKSDLVKDIDNDLEKIKQELDSLT